jgi:hypothetical protein
MSLSTLANAAIARRADFAARPAAGDAAPGYREITAAVDNKAAPDNVVTAALRVITGYIPTEVLTLYVSAVAAFQPDGANGVAAHAPAWLFFVFLALTPLTTWTLFATKLKAGGRPMPVPPPQWPLWEMSAATLAFAVWAIAMPQSVFAGQGWYRAPVAGTVLVTTTMLGLAAPLFQRPLPAE